MAEADADSVRETVAVEVRLGLVDEDHDAELLLDSVAEQLVLSDMEKECVKVEVRDAVSVGVLEAVADVLGDEDRVDVSDAVGGSVRLRAVVYRQWHSQAASDQARAEVLYTAHRPPAAALGTAQTTCENTEVSGDARYFDWSSHDIPLTWLQPNSITTLLSVLALDTQPAPDVNENSDSPTGLPITSSSDALLTAMLAA